MWTFPILIDSRPSFLGAGVEESLLLCPLGTATVLKEMRCQLAAISSAAPVIMTTFDIDPAYERAIREECPDAEAVEPVSSFVERCHSYEASDVLLLADPTCFPRGARDPALFRLGQADDPRWVQHLVALDRAGGTREYVAADPSGRVRAIQRYYDSVTWSFALGLSCSLVPVACLRAASLPPLVSLPHLRRQLASQGVPSRDVPLEEGALNLGTERGLLVANESYVQDLAGASSCETGGNVPLSAGPASHVHPSATILGSVVLQAGAKVEEGATIVGPAVVGRDARVGAGATLAQSVLCRGQTVEEGFVVRHRVIAGGSEASDPASEPAPSHAEAWEAVPDVLAVKTSARRTTLVLKRAFDIGSAALGLVLLAPLGLLIAAAIRLESRGPIHFGHIREGRGGRSFRCWKFRTMVPGADQRQRQLAGANQMDGPQFKIERDPRRTRVGRFLTATNLDELPQLWNVLVGEMSLVGPRPSPFRENQLCVPWREARLSVHPGITGLWQVCRHDRHKGDFHQWIYYDLLYVQNQSVRLDLKILAATVASMARKGAHVPLSWLLPAAADGERAAALRGFVPRPPGPGEQPRPVSRSLTSANEAHRPGRA